MQLREIAVRSDIQHGDRLEVERLEREANDVAIGVRLTGIGDAAARRDEVWLIGRGTFSRTNGENAGAATGR